jgi:hypothetical protein
LEVWFCGVRRGDRFFCLRIEVDSIFSLELLS